MKILLRSGIYWLWEKWDGIHFKKEKQIWRNQSFYIDEERPEFKTLSFDDSDIHLIFSLWLFCILLAALALAVESLTDYFRVKFINFFSKIALCSHHCWVSIVQKLSMERN